jgi:hypothetical protein
MKPDIVTNAIVAALSVGAVQGADDTAKSAIADDCQGLKFLIEKKFGHDSEAAEAISKPESGRKQTLAEELKAVSFASGPELVYTAPSCTPLFDRNLRYSAFCKSESIEKLTIS